MGIGVIPQQAVFEELTGREILQKSACVYTQALLAHIVTLSLAAMFGRSLAE
jgi:hypothetical protein